VRSQCLRAGVGVALALTVSTGVGPARADDAEDIAMRRVRLTTEPGVTRTCRRLGQVKDDSMKDLRKKIVRAGGDTALLSFGVHDMETIYADVFRCDIPPPPPGRPPAPPPGPAH